MARPTKQAWTPSVDIYWWGELSDEFRAVADDILDTHLSDAAWEGLRRCVRIYAMGLNHELAAAPLSKQVEALRKVAATAHELISAISEADTQANGNAVSYHVGDAWAGFFDRESEFERNLKAMAGDLSTVVPEEDAWGVLYAWQEAGRIQRPDPVADLLLHLQEFASATTVARKSLEDGSGPSRMTGDAFQEFIGVLYEWKRDHRIKAGASKGSGSNAGRLTQLVKAILAEVPEIKDDQGKPATKQMRRPGVADASLAEAIMKAAKAYEDNRPVPAQG